MSGLISWTKQRGQQALRQMPLPMRYHLVGRWRTPPTHEYASRRTTEQTLADLRSRLTAGPKPSFLFLPTQTWYSGIFQRPQQLARALAAAGSPVVYVEPWHYQKDLTTDEDRSLRGFVGVRDLEPRIHLLRFPEEQFAALIGASEPDVILMDWPTQAWHLWHLGRHSQVVYEMIDDHELVPGHETAFWRDNHQKWLHQSDVMVASATDLLEICRRDRPDSLLLNNAVCLEDWQTGEVPVPDDIAVARRSQHVAGYYGSIASWFDIELWLEAARRRPDWAFVAIGHAYDDLGRQHIERMQAVPNITYLPAKPYTSLPAYLSHFDVATIPFLLNPITHACSPVKLFEYMAAGRPVVATPMREILQYEGLLLAEGVDAFVQQLDRAAELAHDSGYRATLRRQAEANTWRSRAEALLAALEQARQDHGGLPRRLAQPKSQTDMAGTLR